MSPAASFVGADSPVQYVKIRRGHFTRTWGTTPTPAGQPPMKAAVGSSEGAHANPHYAEPWQGFWTATSGYITLPNLHEVKLSKDLKSNGIDVATIEIENIMYAPVVGVGGKTFHKEERGFLAPLRGITPAGRTALTDEWGVPVTENEWRELLECQVQVTIWQGFGVAAKRFTGLLEDVDLTSRPDRITLTARAFGQVFAEQFFFNENGGRPPMDPEIKNGTVVFVDRNEASNQRDEAYNPNASTEEAAYPKHQAIDFHENTEWRSKGNASAEHIEWFEFAVKEGQYRFLDLEVPHGYEGMEMWISVRPALPTEGLPKREGANLKVGEGLDAEGWVDRGKGSVPEGGHPYTYHIAEVGGEEQLPSKGFFSGPPLEAGPTTYFVGTNSVIRVSFRHGPIVAEKHHIAVAEVHAKHEVIVAAAIKQGWVLVDDISDIVKLLCCWMGFQDWEIENTGSRLPKRLEYHSSETPIDVIKALEGGVGFSFFVKDPKAAPSEGEETELDNDSLGVPTWRKTRVVASGEVLATITDEELLTAIDVKHTTEPLSALIACYGLTKAVPGVSGTTISYLFVPPWAGTFAEAYADDRLAGVRKYARHTDNLLATITDLQFACYFIGLEEALASMQATIDFPAMWLPEQSKGIDLDEHVALLDLGTGLTTRLSVEGRNSTFVSGENASFTEQLTGPLIDTPDIAAMVNIINNPESGAGIGREGVQPVSHTASPGGYE